jgi:hypothetical protein
MVSIAFPSHYSKESIIILISTTLTELYRKEGDKMADPKVPPDLASILATLAQFAPQQQQDQQQTPPPTATTPTITDPRLQRRQQNQSNQPSTQPFNQLPQSLLQSNAQSPTPYNPQAAVFQPVVPQQRAIPQPSRTSTPQQQEQTIIDPATITEWTAGLRCVTKIAAQNPLFAEKIRGVRFICIINFPTQDN